MLQKSQVQHEYKFSIQHEIRLRLDPILEELQIDIVPPNQDSLKLMEDSPIFLFSRKDDW